MTEEKVEEQKKVDDGWEEMEGESSIWISTTEGEEIEGSITEITKGQYGNQYIIQKGDKTWTTPSHKVLQNRLVDCKITDYVKITYVKEELPTVKGRNSTKIYKVQRKIS